MDESTWSRQKWWVQRAYLEELTDDEEIPFTFFFESSPSAPDEVDPVMATDAELAAMGISVIRRA